MSPSRKDRRRDVKKAGKSAGAHNGASGAPSTDWVLSMYLGADGQVPARAFLLACPPSVRGMLLAIVVAVRDTSPPSFPTSHMWHVMREGMKGFHEARDEHDGTLYRLFCIVDRLAPEHGLDAPTVALICGGVKPVRTRMDETVYKQARAYRADYLATRRILLPPGIPASLMRKA